MKRLVAFLAALALSFSLAVAQNDQQKTNPRNPSAKVEAVAKTMTPPERTQLLSLLNEGDLAALMTIPGIGAVRAKAIQRVRPFANVTHVVKAEGIGEGTFAQMVAYAKAGFPKSQKKAPSKKEPSPDKTDTTVPK